MRELTEPTTANGRSRSARANYPFIALALPLAALAFAQRRMQRRSRRKPKRCWKIFRD
jgi:hypothetical protein